MRAQLKTMRRAKDLRQRLTPPEAKLWVCLSRGRLAGLHFRKQHPIGPFILDFYCAEARLAVEIDGQGHALGDKPQSDARRDAWLAREGVRTLRIPSDWVMRDLEMALGAIRAAAGAGT